MHRTTRLATLLLAAALAAGWGASAAAQGTPSAPEPSAKEAQPLNAAQQGARKAEARQKAKGKAPAKSPQARNQAAKELLGKKPADPSALSKDDLSKPFTAAGAGIGPPAPKRQPEADNATAPEDEAEARKRAEAKRKKKEEESNVNFRFGRDQVVDPMTGKDVAPKGDPTAVKESLKNMDLKGALEKSGGKAEVQVDILKF